MQDNVIKVSGIPSWTILAKVVRQNLGDAHRKRIVTQIEKSKLAVSYHLGLLFLLPYGIGHHNM